MNNSTLKPQNGIPKEIANFVARLIKHMGNKRKLEHFAELETFANVIQPTFDEVFKRDHRLKGRWRSDWFKNDYPVILELGCGKGEYTLGLGKLFPDKNFIGIDIKGARIWRGAKTALEQRIVNVAFLRTRIEFIESFFAENEIDEIWITFPDPQLKERRERKRLTGMLFLNRYKKFLKTDGVVHLKTDCFPLYDYTCEVIKDAKLPRIEMTSDLYGTAIEKLDDTTRDILSIKTHYEQLFLKQGIKINYLKFGL